MKQPAKIYDLCVIGTGIAGLNALFVAREYLPSGAKVLVIDRNEQCGGMWNSVYDHVRLHQPHPMFTVGHIQWHWDTNWNKPPEYLADKTEVTNHLANCLKIISREIDLDIRYGNEVVRLEEELPEGTPRVAVEYRPANGQGESVFAVADRAILASGFDVRPLTPLKVTSSSVMSTTPEHFLEAVDKAHPETPIVIAGGGKTAMDAICELSGRKLENPVTLINGRGTSFFNRKLFAPKGRKRWIFGTTFLRTFRKITMRYNGNNEKEAFKYFRKKFAIETGRGKQFVFAFLSEEEKSLIEERITSTYEDYLEDIIDTPSGPEMVLRSGEKISIPRDSIIINCTGHLLNGQMPYRPFLSEHGTILSITPRSAIQFLSSASSYFLSHLFFLGRLKGSGLYELDIQSLKHKAPTAWHITTMVHSFHNSILLLELLPFQLVLRCGMDLDRWFPKERRLLDLIDIRLNRKRYLERSRKTLDRIANRYGVRCAPLD
jgi:hypothetical protein